MLQTWKIYTLIWNLLSLHALFGKELAKIPPRGWNSYDSYAWIINETEVLQNAEAVVKYLKPHGYNYIVIDYGWFVNINNASEIYIDKYGRPQPDPYRYPHSADGSGLKWLSQQIHSMGLLFGIHTSRGISIQAYNADTPVYGMSNTSSKDIGLINEQCPWNGQPFMSVNMSKSAGQQFYNSLYDQYVNEWNVDFIKNDCVFAPWVPDQIIGVHNALKSTGKVDDIVYSVSAGNANDPPSDHAMDIYNITNMYRTANDDWDKYSDLLLRFNISAQYAQSGMIGANSTETGGYSWPDADMLPFGYLTAPYNKTAGPYRWTKLSQGQQRIQMVLWSIIRSPLIFGGVAMKLENDSFTLDLLTNKYCLNVNKNSTNNRQISAVYDIHQGENTYPSQAIWAADAMDEYYVAFFNLFGDSPTMDMNVTFQELGMKGNIETCSYQSAFDENDNGVAHQILNTKVPINDTTFYVLTQCM